jgi:hypothetical protein
MNLVVSTRTPSRGTIPPLIEHYGIAEDANAASKHDEIGRCRGTRDMRVTVAHTRSKEEVVRAVDRSFDDLFRDIGVIPVRFAEERRSWQGSTLTFAISAKMGFISTPMTGTIEVTDSDVTIDVDLGILERLIPATKVRTSISNRVRGLLM